MDEWRDIQTAPMDGTEIIGMHWRAGNKKAFVCSWGVCEPGPGGLIANEGKPWWRAPNRIFLAARPTHWKPIAPEADNG